MATQVIIDWFNSQFSATRNKVEFEQMESFCLLWNLFERKVGNNNNSLGLSTIEKFIEDNSQQITVETTIMTNCYNYFQDRYLENDVTNAKFDNLRFRPRDIEYQNKLKKILESSPITANEEGKILGILTIAYRIRNNTFHGTKGLPEIADQKKTFEHLNNFLMNFLDKLQ